MDNAKLEERARACRQTIMHTAYPDDGRRYCNATWDGWGCWNYTLAGSRAYLKCPEYIPGFDPTLTGYRDCKHDATWWTLPNTTRTWSNYTTCVNLGDLEKDKRIVHIFLAGYTISIVFLVISLLVFVCFRQLKCDRIRIHKNLFLSYILNGIVWIMYYSLAALNAGVLANNPIWCQAIHVVTQYFVSCNFFWMFCEGLYLHTVVVVAFTSGKSLYVYCCAIGWGIPVLITIVYTSIRANSANERQRCWLEMSDLQWVVFGPILVTIFVNLLFLCNIVRVLVTKLRAVNSPDTNKTLTLCGPYDVCIRHPSPSRTAARATLILVPLLGLQYIIFPFRPAKGTTLEEVYLIASALVTSFQGMFVALIFCFFNGEVISLVKRKWGQHRAMKGKSTARTTMYTQSVSIVDHTSVQRPKSPRLYDNRKSHKPIFKAISLNLKNNNKKNNGRDSVDYETAQSFL
ncbi:hypothetical protein NP493_741g01026 [Ridgeia piscesae]|uniref:Calcitonin receptor n=1 Tax=Ridgeia piscesae TaxID=27915 RepID=A0AAD9KPF9_RIDPI|nr:hypothetical protein NP493_741g01026 [Ridgeia piscesae]